jgi:hypothetical protein
MKFNTLYAYVIVMPVVLFGSSASLRNARPTAAIVDVVVYITSFAEWVYVVSRPVEMFGLIQLYSPMLIMTPIDRVSHIRCRTARHERGCAACPRREQGKATLKRLAVVKTR